MNLTRRHFVSSIQNKVDIPSKDIYSAITSLLKIINEQTYQGKLVMISKLGIFYTSDKASRIGRNPKTGEPAIIKARTKLNFYASDLVKNK